MTNAKVQNSDSIYLICFDQVLFKMFTFLVNTADKEITTFSIVFYSPNTLIQTGKTHKHKWSFNNTSALHLLALRELSSPFT